MTAPQAAGERFIAAGDFFWMADIAKILKAELGAKAAKVPTRPLPDFVLKLISIFDRTLRVVTPSLGRKHAFSSDKAKRVLGWTPRSATTSIVECAQSLIAKGGV